MSQSQYKYVLYGRAGEKNTINFLKELSTVPNIDKYTLKVDIYDKRYKRPDSVKSVPSLIVPGINEPLVGDMAFTWLQQQKQKVGHNVNQGAPAKANPTGYQDWSSDMGSGFSDNFSYLDGSNIVHSFEFLPGQGGHSTGVPGSSAPSSGGGGSQYYDGNKEKKDELDRKLEQLQSQRMNDVPMAMQQRRQQANSGGGFDSHMSYRSV